MYEVDVFKWSLRRSVQGANGIADEAEKLLFEGNNNEEKNNPAGLFFSLMNFQMKGGAVYYESCSRLIQKKQISASYNSSFFCGYYSLLISMFLSISIGSIHISFGTIKQAILNFDGSKEQSIIQTVRLPRLLVTAFVGANLAVAGALMQALTRNPLASPGIFGINAGASAAMVFLTVLVPSVSMIGGVFGAFLGAHLLLLLFMS
ncbi:iron chelate uptake ABC transporter family permease subunit [Priestia megaterium]